MSEYYKNQRIIRLINMLLLTKDCVTHCFKKKYLKPLKRSRYRLKSTYKTKCHFNKRDQLFFSIKMINDFSPNSSWKLSTFNADFIYSFIIMFKFHSFLSVRVIVITFTYWMIIVIKSNRTLWLRKIFQLIYVFIKFSF